jgi:hypothetical protein
MPEGSWSGWRRHLEIVLVVGALLNLLTFFAPSGLLFLVWGYLGVGLLVAWARPGGRAIRALAFVLFLAAICSALLGEGVSARGTPGLVVVELLREHGIFILALGIPAAVVLAVLPDARGRASRLLAAATFLVALGAFLFLAVGPLVDGGFSVFATYALAVAALLAIWREHGLGEPTMVEQTDARDPSAGSPER